MVLTCCRKVVAGVGPLRSRADGCLDGHADGPFGPFGGVIDGITVGRADHEHVDVVGGAAWLAEVAGRRRPEEDDSGDVLDAPELLGK